MIYALDSNIISYLLKKDQKTQNNFLQAVNNGHEYIIPPMVYYEVKRWLLIKNAAVQLSEFEKLCRYTVKVVMDEFAWEKAIEISVNLTRKGKPIDDVDILIAAYCITNDYVLVTNNTRHFEEIDGLQHTNWKI